MPPIPNKGAGEYEPSWPSTKTHEKLPKLMTDWIGEYIPLTTLYIILCKIYWYENQIKKKMEYVINGKTVVVLYSLMLCSSQQASKRNATPSLTKTLNPSTDFLDLGLHVSDGDVYRHPRGSPSAPWAWTFISDRIATDSGSWTSNLGFPRGNRVYKKKSAPRQHELKTQDGIPTSPAGGDFKTRKLVKKNWTENLAHGDPQVLGPFPLYSWSWY